MYLRHIRTLPDPREKLFESPSRSACRVDAVSWSNG
jgi:hypothetical protein